MVRGETRRRDAGLRGRKPLDGDKTAGNSSAAAVGCHLSAISAGQLSIRYRPVGERWISRLGGPGSDGKPWGKRRALSRAEHRVHCP